MSLPTQGGNNSTVVTSECQSEAADVRAYCEKKFPVGQPTVIKRAVTGETYTELCKPWHDGFFTASQAAESARNHFDEYAKSKSGTLYWRTPPEIAFSPARQRFAYYMRLLISNKPAETVVPDTGMYLPDPGKYFMVAMRHGSVELAVCAPIEHIDDDAILAQLARALRNNVKAKLNKGK